MTYSMRVYYSNLVSAFVNLTCIRQWPYHSGFCSKFVVLTGTFKIKLGSVITNTPHDLITPRESYLSSPTVYIKEEKSRSFSFLSLSCLSLASKSCYEDRCLE